MRRLLLLLAAAACGAPDAPEFQAPAGSIGPALAVAGDRAVLSWTEPADDGHRVMVAERAGGRWSEPRAVIASDALFVNWADFPQVALFGAGRLAATWLQKTAPDTYAYHAMLAISDDGGRRWGTPIRLHDDTSATEHGFVALAPLGDSLAAVWLDGRDAPTMTLRSTTIGAGGRGADVLVDSLTCECCQTALAAAGRRLVTAYRDRTREEIRDITVRRRVAGGWSLPVRAREDGWHYAGCPVNGPQLAARGDTLVLAWFTSADDTARVFAALSTDGGGSFGPAVRVDEGRPLGRVATAWLADGDAAVAWLEQEGDAGLWRVRRLAPDGALHDPVTVARTTPTRAAGFARLAPVADGLLAAWTAPADSGVRVRLVRTLP